MVETLCGACGADVPRRGKCSECGGRLCSTCRCVLSEDRKDRRCLSCRNDYCRHRRRLAHPDGPRERGRRCRAANPEKKREDRKRYRARYRAQKKGCEVAAVDLRIVIERSGGKCCLCNALVPEELRHIDHIIPLSKGGPHSQENLQLLCYRCNCRKSAKLPEEVNAETWVNKPHPDQPFLLNPNWRYETMPHGTAPRSAAVKGDDRRAMKVEAETARIWNMIAAAKDQSRDAALQEEGRLVLDRLKGEGKIP